MAGRCVPLARYACCTRPIPSLSCVYKGALATANTCHHSYISKQRTRHLHTSAPTCHFLDARDPDHHDKEQKLTVRHGKDYFDDVAKKAKDKKTFQAAVATYLQHQEAYRRGHVEFIYASLERMKEFQVHRDLDTYKKVFELFPKGKLWARSAWEVEFMHYPKQQQCGIDILDQMEDNGVIPDDDMGYQLVEIFGKESHTFRKYRRMMYWMPKFKFMNPYYVPFDLPKDQEQLAKMALERMSVDLENKVTIFQTEVIEGANDQTFIASAQSSSQRELVCAHPPGQSVVVEGGYFTYLRDKSFIYYVLRGPTTDKYNKFAEAIPTLKDNDDAAWNMFEEEKPSPLSIPPSVHEQEDGTIYAMCITGTSSKDSLASWVKLLEKDNPGLASLPIVFLLRSPETDIQTYLEEDGEAREEGKTKVLLQD